LRSLRLLACVLLALVARPAAAATVTVDQVAFVVLAPVAEASQESAPRPAAAVTRTAADDRPWVAQTGAQPGLEATSFRATRDVYLLHCSLLC
jgi:hypothetical protein